MDRQQHYYKLFQKVYQEKFHDIKFGKSQLLSYLQLISQEKYDQEMTLEIWDRMKKKNDISSIDEFVHVFFEAEHVLMEKQNEANEVLNQLNDQLREIENLYNEALEEKQKTPLHSVFYGGKIQQPTNNGRISITIKEIKDQLQGQQNTQYYISIRIGKEEQKTLSNNLLKWNQTFSLFTADVYEQIVISLYQDSKFITQPLGIITLNLQQYKDQLMHNEFINFKDPQGRSMEKLLELDVQWIFSAVQFYENKITEWERRINEEEQILSQISKDLINLQSILYNLEKMNGSNQINDKAAFPAPLQGSNQIYQQKFFYFCYFYILLCGIISFERKFFLNV